MWSLFLHNHHVDVDRCAALSSVPKILDVASLSRLLSCLEVLPVCPGHPDMHFIEMVNAKKGQLRGHAGDVVAFTDSYAPVHLNGELYARTVLTSSCELLLHTDKCSPCNEYHPHLRALYSQWSVQKHIKRVNLPTTSSEYPPKAAEDVWGHSKACSGSNS